MKLTRARVDHMIDPIGYHFEAPVFSWVMEDMDGADPFQLRYRIRIESDGAAVYTSAWDRLDPRAVSLSFTARPRTKYEWYVDAETEEGGISSFSGGTFESGKEGEAWHAQWITGNQESKNHPVFSRTFFLNGQVKKARLYVTGLGLYEAYINGCKAGDEFLTPGCCDYEAWLPVQTYDVTDLLKTASGNRIEILCGAGWYIGEFGFQKNRLAQSGRQFGTIAELWIECADGSSYRIDTDETWTVRQSRILSSGIYLGEIQDAEVKEIEEPVTVYGKYQWKLTDRRNVPILAHETFYPKILHTPKGETVLDLGQNHAGSFHLKVREDRGTTVLLEFGEVLQDGNFYRDNLRGASAVFRYTSDGNERVVRPHFTYYGYRYVRLNGFSRFRAEDYVGFAIYSDMEMIGRVRCGHAGVNQLIANTEWGMKSNFIDVPTDCPQRDERLGWTGDAQIFSETAMYFADTFAFYRKYMYDMVTEQRQQGGKVPDVVPSFHVDSFSSAWGDAACIIPWNMYLFTGDSSILAQQYESMKAWISFIQNIDGANHGWRQVFHYGDWLALDSPFCGDDQVKGETDEGFIADIYYRKSVMIVSKTADILGYAEDAVYYRSLAEKIQKELLNEYFSSTGRCCVQTQTAAVLILSEELSDREHAKKQLLELLDYREGNLSTGFVGTPLLCRALTDIGEAPKAYHLLLNRRYPGWLYAVDHGATTIWERWNSLDESGHISSTGMNSLNHYAYGSVCAWIWNSCVGFRPMEEHPGWKMMRISPHVSYKLSSMEAEYLSPAGKWKLSWKVEDEYHLLLELDIPAGCSAYLELPLPAGELVFAEGSKAEEELKALVRLKNPIPNGHYLLRWESSESLVTVYSSDSVLQSLLSDPEARAVLERVIPDYKKYVPFGRYYPLRETMDNYHDGSPELYEQLDRMLLEEAYSK